MSRPREAHPTQARAIGALAALMAGLALAGQASADPASVSRLGWTVNGSVDAAARLGNTLYVGGDFTRVSPFSAVLESLFGLSPVTGEPVDTLPVVDGSVSAIEPDGAGGYYIGGRFSTVGGHARPGLARVGSDGTVDPAFLPELNVNAVEWIARDTGRVFIGGSFTAVGAQPRPGLAAVDGASGGVTSWTPEVSAGLARRRGIVAAGRLVEFGLRAVVVSVKPLTILVVAEARALDLATGTVEWQRTLGASAGFAGDVVEAATGVIVGGSFGSDGCLAWLDAGTGEIRSTPTLPSCSIGGSVHALARAGDTLYVAGSFSHLGGQARSNAAAVDLTTGAVTTWNPQPDDLVSALAVSATGSVYLGGTFSNASGQPRDGLAEIDAAEVLTGWTPNAFPRTVNAIEVAEAGTVVVGGSLAVSGGARRRHLAAFDLLTGTLLDWAPAADDPVTHMAAADGAVFVAGRFQSVNGASRSNLAAIDGTTAALLPWNPNPLPQLIVTSLLAHADHVYLAGLFGSYLRRVHRVSGAIDSGWAPNPNFSPYAMLARNGFLYLGGEFTSVRGEPRFGLAAVDLSSGMPTSWNPGASGVVRALALDDVTLYAGGSFTSLAGQPRSNLGGVNIHTGAATPWSAPAGTNGVVTTLAIADGRVIVAGDFTTVGGQPRHGMGAVDAEGEAVEWNPEVGRPRQLVAGEADLVAVGTAESYVPLLSGVDVFALSGSARPANLRARVTGARVLLTWTPPAIGATPTGYAIEAGSVSGSANLAVLLSDSTDTSFSTAAPNGIYYVRVRAILPTGDVSDHSNEVVVFVGCTAPPPSPANFRASIAAPSVVLSWSPVFGSVTEYRLEAGATPGSTVVRGAVPPWELTVSVDAPPGIYFVRVRAANACGVSGASNELGITVGSPSAVPGAPQGLGAVVAGSRVSLSWAAPSEAVTSYVVEVGSGPGLANLAAIIAAPTPPFVVDGVPRGVYYVRVRAMTSAGVGPPSAEIIVLVP